MVECKESILTSNRKFLWLLTFYQTGPNGLFIFYQVFNLILQSSKKYYCFLIEFALKILKISPKIKTPITKPHDPKTQSPLIHSLFKSIPPSSGHLMLQVV